MKQCTKCRLFKDFSWFFRRGDTKGYRSKCKCCYYIKKGPRKKKSLEEQKECAKLACKKHNAKPERKIKQAFYEATRRAKKLQATPKWLNDNQKAHIEAYYECASIFTKYHGYEWEVDHIIPLKGKLVSGLHVPWNLQVMSKKENQKKSNK